METVTEQRHLAPATGAPPSAAVTTGSLWLRDRPAAITVRPDGTVVGFDDRATALFGYEPDMVIGRRATVLIPQVLELLDRAGSEPGGAKAQDAEALALDSLGHAIPVNVKCYALSRIGHELAILLVTDLRDRHMRDDEMRRFRMVVEQIADSVMITDTRGVIEYVNAGFERLTGYVSSEVMGRRSAFLKSGHHDIEFYRRLWQTITGGHPFSAIFVNRGKDDRLIHEQKTISPMFDADGVITHFISTGKDMTEQVYARNQLDRLANYDSLTGLVNRNHFNSGITDLITRAFYRKRRVGLLYLDLDRFKVINDTLGHAAGDALLKQVAQRLQNCVRRHDMVARLGGDEFAVVLSEYDDESDLALVAQKILRGLREPFEIEGHPLFVTGSIGMAECPDAGTDPVTLLKNADSAMYRAKSAGRNRLHRYRPDSDTTPVEALSLETSLRGALVRGEFALHYQPQIDLATGALSGVEALLRWNHGLTGRGPIPPDRFIPLLEDTGLIVEVGDWVLREAVRGLQAMNTRPGARLKMAVNVSAQQIEDSEFLSSVQSVLDESGVDSRQLEFEITEGVLLKHQQSNVETLKRIAALGVTIALDDFGTGYSSLSYLRRFPISTLKIDRSFVADIGRKSDAETIVDAILSLSHSLGMATVAEGVEEEPQLDFLKQRGCRHAQGTLFGMAAGLDRLPVGTRGTEA